MDDNPNIQRISMEEIQEFKDLDLFSLTWEQTNGRLVLLAYDPRSQTFVYNYSAPGTDGGDQNITLFYGHEDLIAAAIDFGDLSARPSIHGFDNGDGIIAMKNSGSVSKFDFYDVEIDPETNVDRYVFRVSIIGGVAGPPGAPGYTPVKGVDYFDGTPGAPGAPGSNADDGITYKTSNVFTRTSTLFENAVVVVTGGKFTSPTPTLTTVDGVTTEVVWSDGIPSGTEKVWTSSFTYSTLVPNIEDPGNIWSTPAGITDTSVTDYQYSTVEVNPGTPTTAAANWSETIAEPTAVWWIAQRAVKNGIFGAWVIIKIKGETGPQGNGIDIQGRDTPCNILAKAGVANYTVWLASSFATIATMTGCSGFVMDADANPNDAFLKVPDGTGEGGSNWDNIGGVVGTDGASFKYSIVFKRNIGVPATPVDGSFSSPVPTGWSDGIPALVIPVPVGEQLWMTSRHFSDNTVANAALADWITPVIAGDTIDKEVSYAYQQAADATPALPSVAPELWTDIAGETEYFWSATAKKINGVVDATTWKINRIRGEQGNPGTPAINSFLSSVYVKTNADISTIDVTGGTYLSPVPTTLADGKPWEDGIPDGVGAIWFSQVKMSQTDTADGKVWPKPLKIVDSSSIEYRFSAQATKPAGAPVQNDDTGLNSWWDEASQVPGGSPIWMAIGSLVNGVWPTAWNIVRVTGEQGLPGTAAYTYVPSTMFARCDNNAMGATLPVGKFLTKTNNVYALDGSDPVVNVAGLNYTFTDGIPILSNTFPNNGKRVWMIQGVLNSVDNLNIGKEYHWQSPVILADSATIDFQYHAGASATTSGSKPTAPTGMGFSPDSTGWYPNPDQVPGGAFWIAQKNWSEGPAAQWVIYQIRGEGASSDNSGTPLVWSLKQVFDNVGGSGPDACEFGSYWPWLNTWVTGTGAVGDYFSYDSAGTVRLGAGWWSDEVMAWQVGVNGRIDATHVCSVAGVTPPGIPGVYGSSTNPDELKIYVTPSTGETQNIVSYSVYMGTEPFLGVVGTLIATIPHSNVAEALTVTWAPGINYGLLYFYVRANTNGAPTAMGGSNTIYFSKTVQMYPSGFSSPAVLKAAFLASAEESTVNISYYVDRAIPAIGSRFMVIKATSGAPFNGGGLWYANYTREKIDTTAYQINQFGEVIATAAIDFPAQLAISISQPNAGEGVLSITNGQPNEVIRLNVSFIEDVLGDVLEFEGPQFLIVALESLHDTRSGNFTLDAQGSGTSLYSIFPGTSLPTASITILTRSSGLPLPFVISVGINP